MATEFDPQLHILRSVANSFDDPHQKQEAQSARFNLFAALENCDWKSAAQWLEALEVSVNTGKFQMDSSIHASALRAIAIIRSALEARLR